MDIAGFVLQVGIFVIVFSIGVIFTISKVGQGCPGKKPSALPIILLYTAIFAVILGISAKFTTTSTEVLKYEAPLSSV